MDLTASLAIDQRRFTEAFRLLDALYQIHRAQGDLHGAGRALISKGLAAGNALNPVEAIGLFSEGLRLIDARREPKLVMVAVHNLLSDLVDAGRLIEASRLLTESRALYAAYAERLEQLKALWLEGYIAAEMGDDAAAEKAYCEVRKGFAAAELPYDVALVSLDLAAVWLRAGRTGEIRGLIDEVLGTFRTRNIRREAIGALLLLRGACERQAATAALLRSVAAELRRLA